MLGLVRVLKVVVVARLDNGCLLPIQCVDIVHQIANKHLVFLIQRDNTSVSFLLTWKISSQLSFFLYNGS